MIAAPLIGISVGQMKYPASGSPFMAVRPTYPHAVGVAGGIPALIPLDDDLDQVRGIFKRLDGLVLTGGGDVAPNRYGAAEVSPYTVGIDPLRDEIEIRLARWAVEEDKPLLAICRGIQVLNVALGGTLIQDIREQIPGSLRHEAPTDDWFPRVVHEVEAVEDSRLYAALGHGSSCYEVNSLHHQALDRIGAGLRIVASASDGIVEGVEHPDRRFILGVQWHPEALVDQYPPMRALFEALVSASRA